MKEGVPEDELDPCTSNEALRALTQRCVEQGNEALASIEWEDDEESEGM